MIIIIYVVLKAVVNTIFLGTKTDELSQEMSGSGVGEDVT